MKPRAWNSTLPQRSRPMSPGKGFAARGKPLAAGAGLTTRAGLSRTGRRALEAAQGQRWNSGLHPFPPAACKLIDARDVAQPDEVRCCQRCASTRNLQRHHRRGKASGGSENRAHSQCLCNAGRFVLVLPLLGSRRGPAAGRGRGVDRLPGAGRARRCQRDAVRRGGGRGQPVPHVRRALAGRTVGRAREEGRMTKPKAALDALTDQAIAHLAACRADPANAAIADLADAMAEILAAQFPHDTDLAGRVIVAASQILSGLAQQLAAGGVPPEQIVNVIEDAAALTGERLIHPAGRQEEGP